MKRDLVCVHTLCSRVLLCSQVRILTHCWIASVSLAGISVAQIRSYHLHRVTVQAACIQNGADVYIARAFWRRRIKKCATLWRQLPLVDLSSQIDIDIFWRYEIPFFFTLTSTMWFITFLFNKYLRANCKDEGIYPLTNIVAWSHNCECIVSLNDSWNFYR